MHYKNTDFLLQNQLITGIYPDILLYDLHSIKSWTTGSAIFSLLYYVILNNKDIKSSDKSSFSLFPNFYLSLLFVFFGIFINIISNIPIIIYYIINNDLIFFLYNTKLCFSYISFIFIAKTRINNFNFIITIKYSIIFKFTIFLLEYSIFIIFNIDISIFILLFIVSLYIYEFKKSNNKINFFFCLVTKLLVIIGFWYFFYEFLYDCAFIYFIHNKMDSVYNLDYKYRISEETNRIAKDNELKKILSILKSKSNFDNNSDAKRESFNQYFLAKSLRWENLTKFSHKKVLIKSLADDINKENNIKKESIKYNRGGIWLFLNKTDNFFNERVYIEELKIDWLWNNMDVLRYTKCIYFIYKLINNEFDHWKDNNELGECLNELDAIFKETNLFYSEIYNYLEQEVSGKFIIHKTSDYYKLDLYNDIKDRPDIKPFLVHPKILLQKPDNIMFSILSSNINYYYLELNDNNSRPSSLSTWMSKITSDNIEKFKRDNDNIIRQYKYFDISSFSISGEYKVNQYKKDL